VALAQYLNRAGDDEDVVDGVEIGGLIKLGALAD
jgi:hypothetical protein